MNIASLFNLAGPDLLVILIIVLLLFGAKKLPELARGMGQAVREFSKAKDEFEREVTRPPEPAPPSQQKLEQPPVQVAHDDHVEHVDPHGDQTQEVPQTKVI
jgi:sec-independent protein translocase protein TatA